MVDQEPQNPSSKFIILTISILVLAGLGFRLLEAKKSFWLDELHTTELAHVSPQVMIEKLKEDFHAPLYFLAVGGLEWGGLKGHGLRILSILFSMLSLWPLILIARNMKIGPYGLAGMTGVMMLSPFQLRYGVELRPYSCVAFFAIAMAWAAFDSKSGPKLRFLVFIFTAALALFVHYLAAAVILAIGFVKLFCRPAGSMPVGRLILAGTLGVLLFLPWILTMESWLFNDPEALVRSDQVKKSEVEVPEDLAGFSELKGELLLAFPRGLSPSMNSLGGYSKHLVLVGTGLSLLGIALGILCMLRRRRVEWNGLGPILCGFVAMALIGFLCVKFWHRIPIQYFALGAWAWAPLAGLSIEGFASEKGRRFALAVLLFGLAVSAVGEVNGQPRENLSHAILMASDLAKDEDAHLTAIMRQPPQYTNTELFRVYLPSAAVVEPDAIPIDDGRSVVVVTRRTSLDLTGDKGSTSDPIRAKRQLKRRIVVDRAITIYLFEAR